MFDKRSHKELIIIYAFIAIVITMGMAVFNYFQGWNPILIVVVANVWFFCLFYILYLPVKVKRAREKKKEKSKKK